MKRLLIFCFFQVLFSEINVLNLKNTYACLQGTENEMLSPLVGAISWHSDWMKNFYRFADPETACVKLARNIFYYNDQTGHFAITKSISALAAFLAQNNATDLLIFWYSNNRKNLNELVHYKNQLAKNIKGFSKKEFQQLRDKWFRKSKGDFLNDVQKRIAGVTPPNYKLLTQIENAFYELYAEKIPYPSFVLDQILATYWFIAQPDDDMIPEYVNQLLGKTCSDSLPERFHREELKEIENYSDEDVIKLLDTDLEKVALLLLELLGKGKNPPFVNQGSYRYQDYTDIPDCVESTLRNFFNFILFDGNQYNFDLLPETIRDNINPELQKFYKQFPLEETLSQEAGQAWFNLMASLRNIDNSIGYNKEICEVYGSSENVIKIINVLLNVRIKDFTDMGKLLSTPQRSLFFDATDIEGEYFISIPQENREAKFVFEKKHASCSFVPRREILNHFFDIISQKPYYSFNLIMLALSLPIHLTENFFNDHSYLYLVCDQDNPNVLVDIVKEVVRLLSGEISEQSSYCSWLKALINNIKIKDWFLYRKALGAIVSAYNRVSLCVIELLQESESPQELFFIGAEFGASAKFLSELLEKGVQHDEKYGGMGTEDTAFMLAALRGQLDVLKILFDLGVDVDVDEKNYYGDTALMLSLAAPDTNVAEYLIQKGASLDNKDNAGETALMWAVKRGRKEF